MRVTGNAIEPDLVAIRQMTDYFHIQSWTLYGYVLKIALVLFVISLVFSLSAEEGFISNIVITDDISPYTDYPYGTVTKAIYTTSDDGVVVIAQTSWEMDEMNYIDAVTVIKLDSFGNLLWQHTIGGEYPLYSAYTVTGVGIDANDTVSFIASFEGPYLFEIYSNGGIEYTQLDIEYPSFYNLNKALRTDTGDIIAVGYGRPDGNSQNYPIYCRFSADGETLAQAFFAPDSTFTNADAYDAVIDNDGNVLVGCRLNLGFLDLLKLDLDGNLISRTALPGTISNTSITYWVHLSHNPGADHILAAYWYAGVLPYPDGYVSSFVRITESGMNCQTFAGSEIMGIGSILEIGNDVFVAATLYVPINSSSLFRFNYTQGYALEWVWNDPQFNAGYVHTDSSDLLSRSVNNCIFAVGWESGAILSVAKVLPNGQVPIEDEVQTPALNTLFVYPNPMQDNLYIKLNNKAMTALADNCVDIYNIKGQKVCSIVLNGNEARWNGRDFEGNNCSTGLYLVRYSSNSNQLMKIVKTN